VLLPGSVHSSLPPYGVGYFVGGGSLILTRCTLL